MDDNYVTLEQLELIRSLMGSSPNSVEFLCAKSVLIDEVLVKDVSTAFGVSEIKVVENVKLYRDLHDGIIDAYCRPQLHV